MVLVYYQQFQLYTNLGDAPPSIEVFFHGAVFFILLISQL
jgi:hypothetical protein